MIKMVVVIDRGNNKKQSKYVMEKKERNFYFQALNIMAFECETDLL